MLDAVTARVLGPGTQILVGGKKYLKGKVDDPSVLDECLKDRIFLRVSLEKCQVLHMEWQERPTDMGQSDTTSKRRGNKCPEHKNKVRNNQGGMAKKVVAS